MTDEVTPRLLAVEQLMIAAVEKKIDVQVAIDGALRLLATAEDFIEHGPRAA